MKILWFVYPFCLLFILVGLWISLKSLKASLRAKQAQSWPTVHAELSACELINNSDSESISLEVKVVYHYTVKGQSFTSDKIHPAYSSSSASGHQNLYHKLNNAAVVEAHYNPSDPSEAYLITENYGFYKAGMFMGMIFASSGLFFMLTFHYALTGSSNFADDVQVIQTIEEVN